MIDFITSHEPAIRLTAFGGVLLAMLTLQHLFPRKQRVASALARWRTNGLLVVIDSIAVRLLGPFIAVVVAAWAGRHSIGLFALTPLPIWLEIILAIILLDMAIYAQHVASHKIPMLWRFHQVHHADRDIDATTGVRFHPVEIIISMLYKAALMVLIGPAVVAVIMFEVLLNGSAIFNHANVLLPKGLDRVLRRVIVTPDMHRVHHSVYRDETDSNYGFFLSVWDHVFKTWRAEPRDGHAAMVIGLPDHQDEAPTRLLWSLSVPFHKRHVHDDEPAFPNDTSQKV